MVDTKLHMICIWILLCAFCACPQGVCSRWWMVMFLNFATLCFFICLLKELGSEHAKSHWLHVYIFLQCACSNDSSNCLAERMYGHIGCICATFLRCVFSNVSSNGLPQRMHSHTGCICLTFLHCGFPNDSPNSLDQSRHSHICCICLAFLHCVCSNVSSNGLHEKMHLFDKCHIKCCA